MPKQVALIRGINVGRAKRIGMADLQRLVEQLGFTDVRTLLNSGNIVFSVPPKVKGDPAAKIQAAIAAQTGVSARVMTFTAEHFDTVVADNPLSALATNPSLLLVAFVSQAADRTRFEPLLQQTWSPDVLALGSLAAYLWCPNGSLAGKLFPAVDRLFGNSVTTRNWATVLKLHAMLRG
jgi:uncharacterized protein (DUF1697 family)